MPDIRAHSVDGIEEYDNPLPRWWLYGFYLTIGFALVYSVIYPSFWFWGGTSRWSAEKQYASIAASAPKPSTAGSNAAAELPRMAADAQIVAAGRAIFVSNCTPCHGMNAEGKIGPPLVPHRWRYGGDPASILLTIRKGRPGGMPTWGAMMPDDKIITVAAYVYSLSHGQSAPDPVPSSNPAASPRSVSLH